MRNFFLLNIESFGSVPDWCMVIVTTLTAYYLYKTLQSQKEVQKVQTRLFEIESVRFRESIKPKFSYKLSDKKQMVEERNQKIITIEISNETDSLAQEIKTEYVDNEDAIPVAWHPNPHHLVRGDNPIYIHFAINTNSRLSTYIVFAMIFKDVSGAKYKQEVLCIYDDDYPSEIKPFLPELQES